MQASSVLPLSLDFNLHGFSMDFAEISFKMIEDFSEKLIVGGSENELKEEEELSLESEDLEEKVDFDDDDEEEEKEEDDDDEEEFSFVCMNLDGSSISTDDIFQDGQIRLIFLNFDQSLLFVDDGYGDSSKASDVSPLWSPLKKLFVEVCEPPLSSSSSNADELEGVAPGTYCKWSKKAVEASPELRKKSNSTGFSRFWRFRELVFRSNSDGKDVFVFLNPNSTSMKQSNEVLKKVAKAEKNKKPEKERKVFSTTAAAGAGEATANVKAKIKSGEMTWSAHERHFVRNRAKKEMVKRILAIPARSRWFLHQCEWIKQKC